MSVLCIDAGNSRLKWGVRDGGVWLARGMHLDAVEARPARILACNVAGDPSRQSIGTFAAGRGLPVEWLLPCAAQGGVTNGYDHPAQLGADRWAALIAARAMHAGPSVVVMAGTATTIDVLDGNGRFCGGLILPGLSLMRAALARNTAGLPHAAGHYRRQPTNTDDAIASGAIHATLGAIERMCATLGEDALCLLSGGAAGELAPHLERPLRQVDNLVLEGLARYSRTI